MNFDEKLAKIWALSESHVAVPSEKDTVYNDECMFSFASTLDGLYVNMKSWIGFSKKYLVNDLSANDNVGVYIHIHTIEEQGVDVSEVSRLAIGVEGGFGNNTTNIISKYSIFIHSLPEFDNSVFSIDDPIIPEPILVAAKQVIGHKSARDQQTLVAWESMDERPVSKYANDLVQEPLGNHRGIINMDPSSWVCEKTGFKDGNLWMNLSDGFIGSGRRNFDNSGGTNGAVDHYTELLAMGKNYPLVVKLGTITSTSADVYSYASDEDCMVEDPKLMEHLSHWGIDVLKLSKTEFFCYL